MLEAGGAALSGRVRRHCGGLSSGNDDGGDASLKRGRQAHLIYLTAPPWWSVGCVSDLSVGGRSGDRERGLTTSPICCRKPGRPLFRALVATKLRSISGSFTVAGQQRSAYCTGQMITSLREASPPLLRESQNVMLVNRRYLHASRQSGLQNGAFGRSASRRNKLYPGL